MASKAFKKLIRGDCEGVFEVLRHDPADDTYLLQNTKLAKKQVVGFGPRTTPEEGVARTLTNNFAGVPSAGCWVRSETPLTVGSTISGTLTPHPSVAAADGVLPTLTVIVE